MHIFLSTNVGIKSILHKHTFLIHFSLSYTQIGIKTDFSQVLQDLQHPLPLSPEAFLFARSRFDALPGAAGQHCSRQQAASPPWHGPRSRPSNLPRCRMRSVNTVQHNHTGCVIRQSLQNSRDIRCYDRDRLSCITAATTMQAPRLPAVVQQSSRNRESSGTDLCTHTSCGKVSGQMATTDKYITCTERGGGNQKNPT